MLGLAGFPINIFARINLEIFNFRPADHITVCQQLGDFNSFESLAEIIAAQKEQGFKAGK